MTPFADQGLHKKLAKLAQCNSLKVSMRRKLTARFMHFLGSYCKDHNRYVVVKQGIFKALPGF
jgi:hypothetical protein